MRLAILRPQEHLPESIELAREKGFEVIAAPMVEVSPLHAPDLSERIMWADWVVFTSPNGVQRALELVTDLADLLATRKTAAIGPGTAQAMIAAGIEVEVVPGRYSSEGLADALDGLVKGKKVEVIRSSHGRLVLLEMLKTAGAEVHETPVYELIRPRGTEQEELIREVARGEVDAIAFTSSLTVENFLSLARDFGLEDEVRGALAGMVVAAIGPPTAETLKANVVAVDIIPQKYTFTDLIDEIERYWRQYV